MGQWQYIRSGLAEFSHVWISNTYIRASPIIGQQRCTITFRRSRRPCNELARALRGQGDRLTAVRVYARTAHDVGCARTSTRVVSATSLGRRTPRQSVTAKMNVFLGFCVPPSRATSLHRPRRTIPISYICCAHLASTIHASLFFPRKQPYSLKVSVTT